MQKKAVILFSGGLDSTTCLALAKSEGYLIYALSIDYGQKHQYELSAAKKIAKHFQVLQHHIVALPLNLFGGSALTDHTLHVPNYTGQSEIPLTYVPARNTIFLSLALGWAEVIGAADIFIGANILDYSGYPDCRPEFLNAFEHVADLGTKKGVEGQRFKIHSPLIQMNKAEIILLGQRLNIDYSMTVSCYRLDAHGRACGECDSCFYRRKGFQDAGCLDVTHYRL